MFFFKCAKIVFEEPIPHFFVCSRNTEDLRYGGYVVGM